MSIKCSVLSEGCAYGKIFNIIDVEHHNEFINQLPEEAIKSVKEAFNLAIEQTENIKEINETDVDFLDAHILILKDQSLLDDIYDEIKRNNGTKKSIELVFDRYSDMMKQSDSEYLQERSLDFLDLKIRVLQCLSKKYISLVNLDECILLVDELFPSTLIEMSKNVKGIIALNGGYTSHSAILCRALEIPYVVCEEFHECTSVLIDTSNEEVILDPCKKILIDYVDKINLMEKLNVHEFDLEGNCILGNVSSNIEIEQLTIRGFDGVGLYRTEFILMDPAISFNRDKQSKIYKEAIELVNGKELIFRTFDIGDDKKIDYLPTYQKGVGNYLKYKQLFNIQIDSILIACRGHENVKIMFPMIETYEEFKMLEKIVNKRAALLNCESIPKLGMMMETAKAISCLSSFKSVSFMSIGTNDLTTELFNISRDKILLYTNIYDSLLIEIRKVVNFCRSNKIDLCVCGELAGLKDFSGYLFDSGIKKISISRGNLNNVLPKFKKI